MAMHQQYAKENNLYKKILSLKTSLETYSEKKSLEMRGCRHTQLALQGGQGTVMIPMFRSGLEMYGTIS